MSSETVKGTSTLAAASMEESNKTTASSPLANQVVTSGTVATSRSKVMPTNQNEATATPPPSLATTKESSASKASSLIEGKRLIRTIRPIDVRKLQQAGLDRKIAEALSKQKQKQTKLNKSTAAGIVKVSSSSANITPTHVKFMKPIATLSVSSSSMASASPLPGTEPKQPPLQPQPPAAQGMPYVLNPTSRTASTTAISSTSPPSLTVTAGKGNYYFMIKLFFVIYLY